MRHIPPLEAFNRRGDGHLPGYLGMVVTEAVEGRMVLQLQIVPHLLAPNGYLHAGTVVALADTSAGYGCIAHLPDGARGFTTIELKSNHLGTAREGTIVATATPAHLGRTTQVWDSIVSHVETGKTIAIFRCTQMILYPDSMARFWRAGIGFWLILMLTESVNGTLRRLVLDATVGDVRARQIAVLTGSLLMLSVAALMLPGLGRHPSVRWWRLGAVWLGLTLVFEIAVGRALGVSWARIGSDFDLRQGGMLAFGMLIVAAAPRLVACWRDLVVHDRLISHQ